MYKTILGNISSIWGNKTTIYDLSVNIGDDSLEMLNSNKYVYDSKISRYFRIYIYIKLITQQHINNNNVKYVTTAFD